MSYLGYPRLHFSGKFQAAPSTVNNDPAHFNSDIFTPNDQEPGKGASNGWWNPNGSAYWRFRDTKVESVVYKDGSTSLIQSKESLIGMPINGGDGQVPGKLVDLDPEQQMVSEIWGFQIKLGQSETTGGYVENVQNGFTGDYLEAAFSDIWVRYPKGQPDSFFSAVYQSLIQNISWSDMINSKFLDELRDAKGKLPDTLSIKFTVDGFDDDMTSPEFTWGRVVGAIGPYEETEPAYFVNARYLRPVALNQKGGAVLNFAPARIDKKNATLFLDMGNSLLTSGSGGPTLDMGKMEVGILELGSGRKPDVFHAIGGLEYTAETFITERAGIAEFDLTPAMMKLASKNPLAIRGFNPYSQSPDTPSILLAENDEGAFVRADKFVFRLDAGTEAEVGLYATKYGDPIAKQDIRLVHNNSLMLGQVTQGPISGPPVGEPRRALKFAHNGSGKKKRGVFEVTTDKNGKASFQLKAGDPGNPRGYIDGQVYGVQYLWEGISEKEYNANSTNMISVLVFDEYKLKGQPTWIRDVQPILSQYANLYPVMKNILDLNSYHSVVDRKDAMKLVFSQDVKNPNYMPVTRDLSTPKKQMLLDWLDQDKPRYMQINSVEDLRQALQIAIELEHSTLPPYLTAYFSIKPGQNNKASDIIRSVVMEEMLHMSLACNMLNAIGGSPAINKPGFVPIYPTGLPGSLAPGLTVTLKKCSIDQIRDVFMAIEAPEELVVPYTDWEPSDPDLPNTIERNQMTIGWFYQHIAHGFRHLVKKLGAKAVFTGDVANQLTSWHGTGDMITVTNLKTALAAIHEIVEQGEGAGPYNPGDGYDELAHYYKFSEIVEGREIEILDHEQGFAYTGPAIPFDTSGIFPMIDNPGMHRYSDKSRARIPSEEFNKSYTSLLHALHITFNGQPEYLTKAIGMMFSLTVQARNLMSIPIEPDSEFTAGPSFRYYPINYDS
ncbi:MAG: hypothetical protein HEP71_30715 [Roseivirga sp.]|nr:hypothetical protein [Roseivirga sp.]